MPALTHTHLCLRRLILSHACADSCSAVLALSRSRSLARSFSLARSLARGANSRNPTLLLHSQSRSPSLYLPQSSPADMVIRLRIYIHSPIRIHILLPHIRNYTSFSPSFPPYLPCTSIPHSPSLSTAGLIKMVKMRRSRETSVLDC
jgi:hypothetical protein